MPDFECLCQIYKCLNEQINAAKHPKYLIPEVTICILWIQFCAFTGDVYNRLVKGVQELEKTMPFIRSPKYGVLSACPTNLGTSLRASVHIRLPHLSSDEAKLKEMAAEHSLQIRGTMGENTPIEDGVMDISNKRRLGLTEFEMVKAMQTGILALIAAEEELEAGVKEVGEEE